MIKFISIVPTFNFEEGMEKYLLFVISLTYQSNLFINDFLPKITFSKPCEII